MTIRKRLAYATRGFRGGENVTQTLYINEEVALDFPEYAIDIEVLENIPLSVDITPYQEFSVELSLISDEITVDIQPVYESVTIEHIANEVTVSIDSDISVTI